MFKAVDNMTTNVQGGSSVNPPNVVAPMQKAEKTADKTASDDVLSIEQARRAEQKAAEKKQASESPKITEKILKELEQDLEAMHNIGLQFSKHKDTGKTIVKVLNKENDEIIREIPAEDVLDLAVKMEEMIGILFDKEV
jgi:flagellar protein FlaG